MTSVAIGSLILCRDEETDTEYLKPVEDLFSGENVVIPFHRGVAKVSGIFVVKSKGQMIPLHHVGGLRTFSTQTVYYGNRWIPVATLGAPTIQHCKGLVAILLHDAEEVIADGVVCKAVDAATMFPPPKTSEPPTMNQYKRVRIRHASSSGSLSG